MEEVKDKAFRIHFRLGELSVPQHLPLPQSHLLPFSRRKILVSWLAGALVALAAGFSGVSTLSAQTAKTTGTGLSQGTNPPPTPALSHDLTGVWMQYPDGDVPGVPGMNAVSNKTRPPLTPWGQEKFDAA